MKKQSGFIPLMIIFLGITALFMFVSTTIYLGSQIHLSFKPSAPSVAQSTSKPNQNLSIENNSIQPITGMNTFTKPDVISTPSPTGTTIIANGTPQPQTNNYTSPNINTPPTQFSYPQAQGSTTQYSNQTPASYHMPSIPSSTSTNPNQLPSNNFSSGLLNITFTPNLSVSTTVTSTTNYGSARTFYGAISFVSYPSGAYTLHFSYPSSASQGLSLPDNLTIQITNHQTASLGVNLYSGKVDVSNLWAP